MNDIFLADYWHSKNTVVPRQMESKYRRLSEDIDLSQVFCLKELRKIKPNQTVSIDGDIYVIKDNARFGSLKGLQLELRTYQNLKTAYFFAGQKVELEKIDQPIRYCPEINGKRGAAKHERTFKKTGS